MAELSAELFAQRVCDVNLLDELQIDAIWSELGTREASGRAFQTLAVRRELLTNFQVEKLRRGDRSGYFYGDYRILYLVGTGTYARVFRAVHRETGEVVAVKVLRRRFSDDVTHREQFLREGRMGMTLRHPHIVPIHGVYSAGMSHFLVMEFVEGRNLREFLKVRKKLSPDEATRLIIEVTDGLSYASERGITHRDMKLSNVLISSLGSAKLVDFGLAATAAKLTEEALAECPNPRTIDYAGLERATGVRKDDRRSDIYFLGCIYYHMLTGNSPLHETRDRIQRLSISRFRSIEHIARLEPTMPRSVVAVVQKAMHLDPERRHQSPAEMKEELRDAAQNLEPFIAETEGQSGGKTETGTSTAREGATHTVMIIESNVEMQNILRDRLKRRGYRVLVFSDPNRALERFTADQDSPAHCVVFSTNELNESALDAFNQFGNTKPMKQIPAVLLLDEEHSDWKDRAVLDDHRVVLSLPVRLSELCATLSQLLASE